MKLPFKSHHLIKEAENYKIKFYNLFSKYNSTF